MPQTPAQARPQAATTQQPAPYVVPLSAIPRTAEDVRATRIKIEDLRTQLQDFAERRNSVAGELRHADMDARPGYQGRLANLDANINTLQDQIAQATLALSSAPAGAIVAGTSQGVDPRLLGQRFTGSIVPVFALAVIFVPLSIALTRIFSRRRAPAAPHTDAATTQRLDQIQHSVDAIALEVERVSESQRFIMKVFTERPQLGVGAAEPVKLPQRDAATELR